jgi:hypothetical protein
VEKGVSIQRNAIGVILGPCVGPELELRTFAVGDHEVMRFVVKTVVNRQLQEADLIYKKSGCARRGFRQVEPPPVHHLLDIRTNRCHL